MAIFLQDGKYRIEKSLGQGGFGITYLATQVNLNRQVAIKEFYPKDFCDTSQVRLTPKPGDEELVARLKRKFISEARNVAKLDHPNIVKIYDVFEENSTAYFVMEYVEGESLDAMAKRGAMSEADALHYIIPSARALEYVHSENMTHLDVKPANIMVRRKNNTPVLIDFGLAKQYDRTTGGETSTSFVGLSPGYAPIEQYNQGGVNTFSPQIDVYALGATLYRLVTGTTPPEPAMREGNDMEISAPVSAGTRNAIQHAMRMFKSNRTPSMTAFIAELSSTQAPKSQPIPRPTLRLKCSDVNDNDKMSKHGSYLKFGIISVLIIGIIIIFLDRCNYKEPQKDIIEVESTAVDTVVDTAVNSVVTIDVDSTPGETVFDPKQSVVSETGNSKSEKDVAVIEDNDVQKNIEPADAKSLFLKGENYYFGKGGVAKDYTRAEKYFRKAAEQGYAPAQNMLGICYEYGEGVEQDYLKAVEWYRKAAEQGYARAQCNLGQCYANGFGVEQDCAKAVEWYRKAAEQGYARAQKNLGICYEVGRGVEQDYDKAVKWYRKAAVQCYAIAQVYLGNCYKWGRGVNQNYAVAVEWFRKAAKHGNSEAQYLLGDSYENGRGVAKNWYKAVEWYQKAAEQGNKDAKRRLREMGV